MSNLNELKPIINLNPFARFCCTIGNLPSSYMSSLTYEEQLMWFCDYLQNTVIPAVNNNAECVKELQELYVKLKNYVDNYFNNLDVQEEINNKLNEMASTGELTLLLEPFLTQYKNEVISLQNQMIIFNENINTLDNRVSNIITNNESTEGNTELLDIRTEFNGTVAPTAGDAVRQQTQGLSNGTLLGNKSITKRTIANDVFLNDEISHGNVTFVSPNNNTGVLFYFDISKFNIQYGKPFTVKLKGILEYTRNTRLIITKSSSITATGTFLTNELLNENIDIEHEITLNNDTPYIGLFFRSSVATFDTFEKLFKINKPIVEINNILAINTDGIYLSSNAQDSNYEYIVTDVEALVSKDDLKNYVEKNSTDITTYTEITVSTAQEFKTALDTIATNKDNNIATKNNRYRILLNSGNYEMYPLIDKTNLKDQALYKRGIEIPDYVDIIGIGDVTISCTIPESYQGEQIKIISTLNTYGENNFKNLTIIANNCRYCVHDDDGGPFKDRKITFEDCTFIHNDCDRNYWPFPECYGAGYTGGRIGEFKNCIFKDNNYLPFYIHNSTPYFMTNKMKVLIENCIFDTTYENSIDLQDAYNSLTGNITINNTLLKTKLYTRGTNGFNIFGGGNNTFEINNTNNSNLYII